jgi:cytochrome c556
MANGVMPNYKAIWYGFRHQDLANMKLSLQYIAALAGESSRYSPPEKAGSLEDFRRRMEDLRARAQSLSDGIGPAMDRSAVNDRILSIYQTCQSCHDTYAPEERKDARKYTPPR